ncbi:hypothetical protein MKS88_004038 [Plasmodium brasilianum]|uniref:Uncharacterized protein n=1 Tax=Plasmodium brasilianum TaxID=5824 RepID=A0ACB9Y3U5_PLABR|nr:hypothetical protein MKS88_004038 [Plasmodium brasilianum]
MKFLRILLPSLSKKKSDFLTNNHMEHPMYYDKEIVKNIKIHEYNINKNVSISRKKERSKTIIEVHMEVLEEYKNEEWESNKVEFLEICLQEFSKEQYGISTNLTNDNIMVNAKNINDTVNQKIIWNKWIEKYRYLTEKLKKEDWFSNLKNEWKIEQAYLKISEDLKTTLSNENHKIPFIECQKDIWRQWISKKGKIIEQHLEHDWFNGLAKEFLNITDEYVDESLFNIKEMDEKKSYEELNKYIKIKLLKKLCILVLIMVLEDCKKEEHIEYRESYMDSSINEWITLEHSDRKSAITENTFLSKGNVLQNRENLDMHSYKNKDIPIQDLEDWIKKDDTDINSTDNENILENFY